MLHGNWLRDSLASGGGSVASHHGPAAENALSVMQRVGMPIVAGTDLCFERRCFLLMGPGFSLHAELAMLVAEGLTPLNALQAATLNPAKMLRGTDSLGTVAAGKLADLVLLDANPLEDITNTTTIRTVVANGRYFDRATLDTLLTEARARLKRGYNEFTGRSQSVNSGPVDPEQVYREWGFPRAGQ